MTRADLEGLLERIKSATGPDRGIDTRILALVVQPGQWSAADIEYACEAPGRTCDPPYYTGSVDAALTLCNRHVAGILDLTIGWEPEHADIWPAASVRWYPPGRSGPNWCGEVGSAATIPLALCATVLKAALLTQQEASDA